MILTGEEEKALTKHMGVRFMKAYAETLRDIPESVLDTEIEERNKMVYRIMLYGRYSKKSLLKRYAAKSLIVFSLYLYILTVVAFISSSIREIHLLGSIITGTIVGLLMLRLCISLSIHELLVTLVTGENVEK